MFIYILYIFVTIILLQILLKFYQYVYFGDSYKIPGPPSKFLIGNLTDIGLKLEDSFKNMLKFKRQYGQYYGLWMTSFNYRIILSDPESIEQILNTHLDKGTSYDEFEELFGNGLLTSPEHNWKKDRKLLAPSFHQKVLEQFIDNINSVTDILLDILENQSRMGPVNVFPHILLYTFDVTCETIMGIRLNTQNNENSEYVNAVETYLDLFMKKFFSFIRRIKLYYRLTNDYKIEKSSLKTIKEITRNILRTREYDRKHKNENLNEINGKGKQNEFSTNNRKIALLDNILDLKDKGKFNDGDVNDHVNTFLLAGHHTIVSSIAFTLFELAKHPNIQNKIFDELKSIINDNETLSIQKINEMKYTKRVIKESLRMYPPAPFIERTLKGQHKIGSYNLQNNTNIIIYLYGLHHDEKLYENPDKFDPDRFLPENVAKRHPYSFMPFSYGIRNCIGWPFAMLVLKIALINILRKFELSPVVPEHKPVLCCEGTLKSVNGLPINLKLR